MTARSGADSENDDKEEDGSLGLEAPVLASGIHGQRFRDEAPTFSPDHFLTKLFSISSSVHRV